MTNTVYQAAVEALESVLSPRVVSRSLQEGLQQVGKSPDSVSYRDLEKIFKAQIYRQLQTTMPVTEAKQTITGILAQLQGMDPQSGASQPEGGGGPLEQQQQALEELQEALKPYNLYFEWSETQKLRAMLQLLQSELEAGRESGKLITDTRLQLKLVEQKLEDQLVIQARELGELESGLEIVKSLGGPKVKRLDSLIGQIRDSQAGRQLASAEVERARKLVTDLRKLMESSVVAEEPGLAPVTSPAAVADDAEGLLDVESADDALLSIDTEGLPAEVSAKLLLIDLESEQHQLDQLAKAFTNLLEYQPAWQNKLAAQRQKLNEQQSIAEALPELQSSLQAAQQAAREALRDELKGILGAAKGLGEPMGTELERLVQVALGVLETTLPPLADTEQIRQMHRLALERGRATQGKLTVENRRAALHAEQIAELHQLEQELGQYRGLEHEELKRLTAFLQKAKSALEAGRSLESLDPAWTMLDTLRSDLERRIASFEPRLDAALAGFEPVAKLNTDETATVQRILHHLDGQRGSLHKVSASVRAQLETSLAEAEGLIKGLQEQYEATRAIAGQLMSGNMLDDILGDLGEEPKREQPAARAPKAPASEPPGQAQTVVTKLKSRNEDLDAWLEGYLNERGVRGAATFQADKMLAGRLELEPGVFGQALAALDGDLSALGGELGLGEQSLVTLETSGHILISARPAQQYRLVLVLDTPSMFSLILAKLRRDLPALINIFGGPAVA